MHPDHATILAELRKCGRPTKGGAWQNDSYGGSGRPFFGVSVPARRAIALRWLAGRRGTPAEDILAVVENLTTGESHEEKTMAAFLLAGRVGARRAVRPADVDRWLGRLNGWAEIDCLCANLFKAEDFAEDWPSWRDAIERLSKDANINKRRAALVLLTGPVRYADDARFADLALSIVERLKAERSILITKAVSWLLRCMAVRHRGVLEAYLDEQGAALPAIALRETRTKLKTGTKSGRASADRPPRR